MIIKARERRDVRKQYSLTESNAAKIREIARANKVSENSVINCLIRWEYNDYALGNCTQKKYDEIEPLEDIVVDRINADIYRDYNVESVDLHHCRVYGKKDNKDEQD